MPRHGPRRTRLRDLLRRQWDPPAVARLRRMARICCWCAAVPLAFLTAVVLFLLPLMLLFPWGTVAVPVGAAIGLGVALVFALPALVAATACIVALRRATRSRRPGWAAAATVAAMAALSLAWAVASFLQPAPPPPPPRAWEPPGPAIPVVGIYFLGQSAMLLVGAVPVLLRPRAAAAPISR